MKLIESKMVRKSVILLGIMVILGLALIASGYAVDYSQSYQYGKYANNAIENNNLQVRESSWFDKLFLLFSVINLGNRYLGDSITISGSLFANEGCYISSSNLITEVYGPVGYIGSDKIKLSTPYLSGKYWTYSITETLDSLGTWKFVSYIICGEKRISIIDEKQVNVVKKDAPTTCTYGYKCGGRVGKDANTLYLQNTDCSFFDQYGHKCSQGCIKDYINPQGTKTDICKENIPIFNEYCGDGTCDLDENYNNCPEDCESIISCTPTETIEKSCSDNIDNDCDGKIDKIDSDCTIIDYNCIEVISVEPSINKTNPKQNVIITTKIKNNCVLPAGGLSPILSNLNLEVGIYNKPYAINQGLFSLIYGEAKDITPCGGTGETFVTALTLNYINAGKEETYVVDVVAPSENSKMKDGSSNWDGYGEYVIVSGVYGGCSGGYYSTPKRGVIEITNKTIKNHLICSENRIVIREGECPSGIICLTGNIGDACSGDGGNGGGDGEETCAKPIKHFSGVGFDVGITDLFRYLLETPTCSESFTKAEFRKATDYELFDTICEEDRNCDSREGYINECVPQSTAGVKIPSGITDWIVKNVFGSGKSMGVCLATEEKGEGFDFCSLEIYEFTDDCNTNGIITIAGAIFLLLILFMFVGGKK